jgi:hypothetical protein
VHRLDVDRRQRLRMAFYTACNGQATRRGSATQPGAEWPEGPGRHRATRESQAEVACAVSARRCLKQRSQSFWWCVAPSFTERSFGLGIVHNDGLLGRVIFPPWIFALRLHGLGPLWRRRRRPRCCLSVAPHAVRCSLSRASARSVTSRTGTRLERPATAEPFALSGHPSGLPAAQFAGQLISLSDHSSCNQQQIAVTRNYYCRP